MIIHISVASIVSITGFILAINNTKWMILLLLFSIVISTEIINTAIERLADFIEPDINESIRDIKDISAGAVLWSTIVSVIIGIIIFAPEFYSFISFNPNH